MLDAMGLPKERTNGAIRFSFGAATDEEDLLRAAKLAGTILLQLRNK